MAITFPAAPTNGQIYTDTTSGQSWTWDGVKWKGANPDQIHWTRTGTTLSPATAGNTPDPAPAPPAPPAPLTPAEKLAAAGLTVEELKALLAG